MDQQETIEILSELKKLKTEMDKGTVTTIPVLALDEPESTANKWTLMRAISNIRQTVASSLSIKTKGTKLLANILAEAKRVCDQNICFSNYIDRPFEKVEGLSFEMNQCIGEAWSVLEETKQLRRDLEALKLTHSTFKTSTDSASRGKLEEKKIGRFLVKTLEEAKKLHNVLFRRSFEETDEIKAKLERKCDGNTQLYSLFLSGNIVKRCRDELEIVQSCLQGACEKDAENCVEQLSMFNMSKSLSDYVSKVANRNKVIEDEVRDKKNEIEYLEQENTTVVTKCKLAEDNREEIKQKHDQLKEENSNLRLSLADMERELTNKDKSITLLQESQKTLLNRLSQCTSAQLTHDNPNVADLSDPNRPTKIGEQLSELYDNQWTDAFGTLTDNYRFSEEKTITTLRSLIDAMKDTTEYTLNISWRHALLYGLIRENVRENQAYSFCVDSSATQDRDIKLALQGKSSSHTTSHEETAQTESADLSTLDLRLIFNLKKKTSDSSAKAIRENFLKRVKKLGLVDVDVTDIKEYVSKCAEVCWHMVLQSPQLYMESCFEDKETFNTNKYKHYKTKGSKYKFIVWPVLYLHKDGPMLSKGIAEAQGST